MNVSNIIILSRTVKNPLVAWVALRVVPNVSYVVVVRALLIICCIAPEVGLYSVAGRSERDGAEVIHLVVHVVLFGERSYAQNVRRHVNKFATIAVRN